MALASLLVLTVAFGADAAQLKPMVLDAPGAPRIAGSKPQEPFKTAPLQLGRPSLIPEREYFRFPEASPGLSHGQTAIAERKEPATVVCTMRVIRADPTFDAAMVRSVPASRFDRIVRDDVAACTP